MTIENGRLVILSEESRNHSEVKDKDKLWSIFLHARIVILSKIFGIFRLRYAKKPRFLVILNSSSLGLLVLATIQGMN
jgi:hypothetical protein